MVIYFDLLFKESKLNTESYCVSEFQILVRIFCSVKGTQQTSSKLTFEELYFASIRKTSISREQCEEKPQSSTQNILSFLPLLYIPSFSVLAGTESTPNGCHG